MRAPEKPDKNDRYAVSRSTLLIDRFMTFFIRIGGAAIILTVFGILVFIIAQAAPLFRPAAVEVLPTLTLGAPPGATVGMDEHGALPFYATLDGAWCFVDAKTGETTRIRVAFPEGYVPVASVYSESRQRIDHVDTRGLLVPVEVGYEPVWSADGARRWTARPRVGKPLALGEEGVVRALAVAETADSRLYVTRREEASGGERLEAVRVRSKRALGGKSRETVDAPVRLALPAGVSIRSFLVGAGADTILVRDDRGAIHWWHDAGEGWKLSQSFAPFGGEEIVQAGFLFGDMTLSVSSATGVNRLYALGRATGPDGAETRLWCETKILENTAGRPTIFARSPVNKSYLLAGEGFASVRHGTTERVRVELPLDFRVRAAGFGDHYESLWFLDEAGDLRRYRLDDPHPEAGFKAFFGKIRYEGADAPGYVWQSTSGNDDFEPKLSLVPLLFGTLKGTWYAMIFSVPIALTAAVYTARFMRPEVKVFVKPVIELMASLPSVVLGFFAALWLAPQVEYVVPGLMLVCVALPLAAMTFGYVWARLPKRLRNGVPPGCEFLVMLPVAVATIALAWSAGPVFESAVFAGDFPAWWRDHVGAYEQRNALVVGFVMGFAVVPIIFTIAEDAVANVPDNLVSASLALGASRWQTVRRVVLPVASAGIFSALMIGFGRAVGETMIVVMATGNTAVTEWNVFNGMRTASANIAVELPEAAAGSTHYRTLFLCACCLFLLTFLLNTCAEILRRRLREKYKVV